MMKVVINDNSIFITDKLETALLWFKNIKKILFFSNWLIFHVVGVASNWHYIIHHIIIQFKTIINFHYCSKWTSVKHFLTVKHYQNKWK